MVRLDWTEEAEIWLSEIFQYIAKDNPAAAKNVVENLYQRAQDLRLHIRLGQRFEFVEDREIRVLRHGHYRIAYWIKSASHLVVLGVFHDALPMNRYIL